MIARKGNKIYKYDGKIVEFGLFSEFREDLFHYYKCSEDGNQYDYSGNGNTGILADNPTFVPEDGVVEGCFNFENTTKNRIQVNDDFSTLYNQDTWSFSSWINPFAITGNAYRALFRSADISGSPNGMGVYIRASVIIGYDGANVVLGNYTPIVDEWQHVVVTFNNPTWKLYINGQLFSTATKSRATTVIKNRYGNDGSNFSFGKMDEIMFWGRELNDEQILKLYENTTGIHRYFR